MITIDTNPEFGIELVLTIPYAYWLHKNNKLEKVITSKGMKPFYYFCNNVEEKYDYRTIDNAAAGLNSLPNNWIYGMKDYAEMYKDEWDHWKNFMCSKRGCGILDYRKWKMPNYNEYYKNNEIVFDNPVIFVTNKFNYEHDGPPVGYFDIKCLYEIFNYLVNKGYSVIYKRPKNTEFPLDQNEAHTLMSRENLTADVDGIGVISDYELTGYYEDVHLFDDIVAKYPQYTYNELQLKSFANSTGFITIGGGNALLKCLFQKPTVGYWGRRMNEAERENFWKDKFGNKNIKNYHYMINPNLKPFIDANGKDMLENNYGEFLNLVKETFNA